MKWRREPRPFFRSQTRSWYAEIDGRQINLGVDETKAAIAYHQAMVDHYSADPDSANVQKLVVEFLAAIDVSEVTRKWYERWLTTVPDRDIATLDEKAVKAWLRSLPGGSHTQRAGVRSIKRFVKWCADEGHPVQNLSKIKAQAYQPRDRYLTDTEWAKVQETAKAKPQVLNILRFMYLTGCRPEEARIIEPRHFDPVNCCFTLLVDESKGEQHRRTIYLTEEALTLVMPLMDEGPIFKLNGKPWTKYSLSKQVRMLARDAKVNFSAYTMRHTFISRAIRNGVNLEVLRRLVGHRDLQMISTVYAHVDAGELRQAAAQAVA